MESTEKIMKILKKDFSGKRETIGKGINKETRLKMEEIRKEDLSREELETLKTCYEVEYNDSNSSIESSIALIGIVIPICEFFSNLADIMAKTLGENTEIVVRVLYGILIAVYFFVVSSRVLVNSRESVKLRNNVLAVNFLLLEMGEETKKIAPSPEAPTPQKEKNKNAIVQTEKEEK